MPDPKQTVARVIRVTRRPGRPTEGILRCGPLTIACVLGRSGVTRFKREGDGASPAARMGLVEVRYRSDRIGRPATRLPVRPTRSDDGWCDDPSDGRYNRPVRLPFARSHEKMARPDGVYDIVVVLDWNVSRRRLGRGSAIFLHLVRPDRSPTAGCVAVGLSDMRRILARAGRTTVLALR